MNETHYIYSAPTKDHVIPSRAEGALSRLGQFIGEVLRGSIAPIAPPAPGPNLFTPLESRVLYDGSLGAVAAEAAAILGADVLAVPLDDGAQATATPGNTDPGREVAVIDTGIKNHGLLEEIARNAGMDVILISAQENGFDRLAQSLENGPKIDALHILSHGSQGEITLGSATLSIQTMDAHSLSLALISQQLNPDADILLYGCQVGETDAGTQFIEQLAIRTQADIAASDDLTGQAAQGGDWDLEVQVGDIEADSPFDAKSLKDFSEILSYTGTLTFSSADVAYNGAYHGNANVDARFNVGNYVLIADGTTTRTFGNGNQLAGGIYNSPSVFETQVTLRFSNNETFDATGLRIFNYTVESGPYFGYRSFILSSDQGHSYTLPNFYWYYRDANINFTGITELTITSVEPKPWYILVDNLQLANVGNVAPTLTAPPSDLTITQGNASNIDLSTLSLGDANNDTLTLTITADTGYFTQLSDGAGIGAGVTENWVTNSIVTLTGTAADIDTYLNTPSNIQYQNAAQVQGENAASLTLSLSDGHLSLGADPVVNLDIISENTPSAPASAVPMADNGDGTADYWNDAFAEIYAGDTDYSGMNWDMGSYFETAARQQSTFMAAMTTMASSDGDGLNEEGSLATMQTDLTTSQTIVNVDAQGQVSFFQADTGQTSLPIQIASVDVNPQTQALTLVVQSTGADTVIDLQAGLLNGAPLPEWLLFVPESGTFTGIPPQTTDEVGLQIMGITTRGNSFSMEVEIRFEP